MPSNCRPALSARTYEEVGNALRAPFSQQDPAIWNVDLASVDPRCPVTQQNEEFTQVPTKTSDEPSCHVTFEKIGKETLIPTITCDDGTVIMPETVGNKNN